jgi:hypothetical protein
VCVSAAIIGGSATCVALAPPAFESAIPGACLADDACDFEPNSLRLKEKQRLAYVAAQASTHRVDAAPEFDAIAAGIDKLHRRVHHRYQRVQHRYQACRRSVSAGGSPESLPKAV